MDAIIFFRNLIEFFIDQDKINNFEDKLFLNSFLVKNFNEFIKQSILIGLLVMTIGMVFLYIIFSEVENLFLIGTLIFFVPFFVNYIFVDILFEKRKRKREELLPDLLLEGSVFCDQKSLLKTIHSFSKQDINFLSSDFERIYFDIKNGSSIKDALNRNKRLNKSESYNRVIDLLLQSYSSGGAVSQLLRELAEDLMESKAIIKERQAVMLVTKYTLLMSAGLIVPAILGTVIGLVLGLGIDSMSTTGIGLSVVAREELFFIATISTTVYIFEYVVLSSFFLAVSEGNKKQFWIYLLILLPTSIVAFTFAKSLLIT
jgi:pilus assembly protein TadC